MKDLSMVRAANEPITTRPEDFSADPFWGTVSRHKFAEFNLCSVIREENTNEPNVVVDTSQPTIRALLVDGDKTIESQWQTPFENSNPELKMPMLMAGLQTGESVAAIGLIAQNTGQKLLGKAASTLGDAISPFSNLAKSVVGKTNLNKVNTTQVFLSTSGVRLNLTIFFIALKDAKKEVENKLMYLESWALPKYLSSRSVLTDVSAAVAKGGWKNAAQGLFSGEVPPYVSVTTHGKTYMPFILESVSAPIVAPIDSEGNRLSLTVNLSLISRTAWDAQDIFDLYDPDSSMRNLK